MLLRSPNPHWVKTAMQPAPASGQLGSTLEEMISCTAALLLRQKTLSSSMLYAGEPGRSDQMRAIFGHCRSQPAAAGDLVAIHVAAPVLQPVENGG